MEQKINEENIENNFVFCIDPRKAFTIKSIQTDSFSHDVFKSCLLLMRQNEYLLSKGLIVKK